MEVNIYNIHIKITLSFPCQNAEMPTVSTPWILCQMNDGPMYRPLSLKGHSFKAFTSS